MGKLIVIDGIDGSGKATQTTRLALWLKQKGYNVRQLSFPDYEHRSSELVKMYLNGEIAKKPQQVNAYAAASFYACDRYISFHTNWKDSYESDDTFLLADRYISSNAIHQMVKLPKDEWDSFLQWLYHYECDKLKLPHEDLVIYLDIEPKISNNLLNKRYHGDNNKRDIHEQDNEYLIQCRDAAMYAASLLHWTVVKCNKGQALLSIQEISKKIEKIIKEMLK